MKYLHLTVLFLLFVPIAEASAEVRNCVTAIPDGFASHSYSYVPCDEAFGGVVQKGEANTIQSLPQSEPIPNNVSTPSQTLQRQSQPQGSAVYPNYYQNPVQQDRVKSIPTIEQSNPSTNNSTTLIIIGIVIAVLLTIVGIIASRRREDRQVGYSLPPSTQSRTRRVDGNTITETITEERRSVTNWDENTWNLVKQHQPKDWDKFLKWVATHKEDVEAIKRNSADFKEALYKMLEKAKKDGFGDDLK